MQLKIPKNFENAFPLMKTLYNPAPLRSWEANMVPVIGKLWWVKPQEILWLYAT
jgi:hypothetical protein